MEGDKKAKRKRPGSAAQSLAPKTVSERQKALSSDSPVFRQNMRDKEAVIEKMGVKIQGLVKLLESYKASYVGLGGICDFIETELVPSEPAGAEAAEAAGVNFDFLAALRAQEASFQAMLGRLESDVVSPMQAYHAEEIQVIKKKKKHFENVDDQMDSAMVKYLSMKRDTAPEVLDQAENKLTKKHDSFEIERFDMHCTIEEVETTVRDLDSVFWTKNLAAIVDITADFHTEALAKLPPEDPALVAVKKRLKEEDEAGLATRAEREERRAILEKSTLAFLNQKTAGSTVTEGWLEKQPFDLAAEKKSKFVNKVGASWQRRYFELTSDGKLFYCKGPGDRASCTMPVDFNVVTEVTDVTAAGWRSKKHSEDVMARQLMFVFGGKPCLLKAEKVEDKQTWMNSLQKWVARGHDCQQQADDGAADEPAPAVAAARPESPPAELEAGGATDAASGGGALPAESADGGTRGAADRAADEHSSGGLAEKAEGGGGTVVGTVAEEEDEDGEAALAGEFGAALPWLGADLGHDSKKIREAYHNILGTMKRVIDSPTDTAAKTVSFGNKAFYQCVGQHKGGVQCLKVLGYVDKAYGLAIHDQNLVLEDDYLDMAKFALAYFVLLRACGDAQMNDADLTTRETRLKFPDHVQIPVERPYSLAVDHSPPDDLR